MFIYNLKKDTLEPGAVGLNLNFTCRTIYMDFEKDVKVKGIPAYRFTPPRSVLASKVENPDNAGFCVTPQECLGTGLLRVSPCRKGNCETALSYTHTLNCDILPSVLDLTQLVISATHRHGFFFVLCLFFVASSF